MLTPQHPPPLGLVGLLQALLQPPALGTLLLKLGYQTLALFAHGALGPLGKLQAPLYTPALPLEGLALACSSRASCLASRASEGISGSCESAAARRLASSTAWTAL